MASDGERWDLFCKVVDNYGDGTIVFWHRGFAVSDVVLGNWIYERAERENVGTLFPLLEAGEE